jgi:hypothetical protein
VTGTGLGEGVTVSVGSGETTVWVEILSFEKEQAESPKRSARKAVKRTA